MSTLTITVFGASNLPRQNFFWLPEPFVSVTVRAWGPASDPVCLGQAISQHSARSLSARWDFSKEFSIPKLVARPLEICIAVYDGRNSTAAKEIGTCTFHLDSTYFEGNLLLQGVGGGGEVEVSARWPDWATNLTENENWMTSYRRNRKRPIREVSGDPGRFFRCGELETRVIVCGLEHGVKEPSISCKLPDQKLHGSVKDLENAKEDDTGGQSQAKALENVAVNTHGSIDFGTFVFALFQGSLPENMIIVLKDSRNHLSSFKAITQVRLSLPTLLKEMGLEKDSPGIYRRRFCKSVRVAKLEKLRFDVSLTYLVNPPCCKSRIVTPRFLELISDISSLSLDFKYRYPQAEDLIYLLVGGLFTSHYPGYFTKNIDYLQTVLKLPRVQVLPIHTEGSVEQNAKKIRNSVFQTCRGSKSVVLIGHSKGGVDICAAITQYPEIRTFLYGVIAFQAPFNGSYLIDFLKKSPFAVTVLGKAIENLWGGRPDSFSSMSYEERRRVLTSVESTHRMKGEAHDSDRSCSEIARHVEEKLMKVPTVCLTSCAPFSLSKIRSLAGVAGVATMRAAAEKIVKFTGFYCDGLVCPVDARIPGADTVFVTDMLHSEPALYVVGTKHPPGKLTAVFLALLFEKVQRENQLSKTEANTEDPLSCAGPQTTRN